MIKRIFSNWHPVRIVYLFIGLLVMGFSVSNREWMGFLPGGYFAAMALFHFGCATGGCSDGPALYQNAEKENNETLFEEIK